MIHFTIVKAHELNEKEIILMGDGPTRMSLFRIDGIHRGETSADTPEITFPIMLTNGLREINCNSETRVYKMDFDPEDDDDGSLFVTIESYLDLKATQELTKELETDD